MNYLFKSPRKGEHQGKSQRRPELFLNEGHVQGSWSKSGITKHSYAESGRRSVEIVAGLCNIESVVDYKIGTKRHGLQFRSKSVID